MRIQPEGRVSAAGEGRANSFTGDYYHRGQPVHQFTGIGRHAVAWFFQRGTSLRGVEVSEDEFALSQAGLLPRVPYELSAPACKSPGPCSS